MVKEVLSILSNTIDELSRLYQEATYIDEDTELTEECINAINDYYKSIASITESKTNKRE